MTFIYFLGVCIAICTVVLFFLLYEVYKMKRLK